MLQIAEYSSTNSFTTVMGMSPFFAKFDFHSQMNWPIEAKVKNLSTSHYVHWITSVHTLCCRSLDHAWETMGKYHYDHAMEPPKYSVSDLVMLNGKNLKTRWPSKTIDEKLHGPFKISKVLSPTMIKLQLLSQWRIHNPFHVLLIESY
jgi:hypothetical protein